MGFMDKLKGLFKKKDKVPAEKKADAPAAAPAAAKTYATEFAGSGAVADALKFAGQKIDAKKAAGLSDGQCAAFLAALKAIEASDASDDDKMVQIGQVIGGIINAPIKA